MSWLAVDPSDRDYVQTLKQASPVQFRLLSVLALAIRIEPLLLRNARLQFAPESDIELETDLWFASIIHSRNAKACILREGVARALVDELAQERDDYKPAWQFVEHHTRHWPAQDRLEQQLRLASRTNDTVALQNGFNKILNTLVNTPDAATKRDLSRWFKSAVPSFTQQNETSEIAHLLFQYTSAALGLPAAWSASFNPDAAAMPQWLKAALPSSKENTLGIELHVAALVCVNTSESEHLLTVNLPLPTPVLINTDKELKPRWESLWPGRKIPLIPYFTWLTLQTLEGQLYRFTVSNPSLAPEISHEIAPSLKLLYLPEDREQASQIHALLKQHGINVELVPEPSHAQSIQPSDLPNIRLWSKAAADYWQQTNTKADSLPLQRGLLLRIDPHVELPLGVSSNQEMDFLEWHNPESAATIVSRIQQWLSNAVTPLPEPETEDVEALHKELENPETKPRRRLAIGDRLAELGDPRKGVGVKAYEIIEYTPQVQRLLDELLDINTTPVRRLEIGNLLDEMGDPRPGVGLDENGLPDIDWVDIPAGPFIYGEGENQQSLNLRAFKISLYPVTNKQFQAFIDAGGYQDERWWQDLKKPEPNQPGFAQANRPRETIDWYEAIAFTRWLSEKLGVKVNLPTEQQWEKAARGSDGRQYPWGSEFRSGFANYYETKDDKENLGQTSAVGVYPHGESPYQVADMAGNVWEWCLNDYKDPRLIRIDQTAHIRVLRGGSWGSGQDDLRSAYRRSFNPGDGITRIGFRLAQDLP